MTEAVGSIETRPWLPGGLSLGWTRTQQSKPSDEYVERKGPVVVVLSHDRSQVVASFPGSTEAEEWAKALSSAQVRELLSSG